MGGHVVLKIEFRGIVLVCTVVNLGINQRQRDLGHASWLAIPRTGEDHVFHARAAQGFCRLLAKNPRDGIGNVRFAAAVWADNGGDALTMKLEFGAVAKRLESENLKSFQFEQRALLFHPVIPNAAEDSPCEPSATPVDSSFS